MAITVFCFVLFWMLNVKKSKTCSKHNLWRQSFILDCLNSGGLEVKKTPPWRNGGSFIKDNVGRRGNGRPTVHPLYHRVNMTNGAEFGMIKDEIRIHLHQIWKLLSAAFCLMEEEQGGKRDKEVGGHRKHIRACLDLCLFPLLFINKKSNFLLSPTI